MSGTHGTYTLVVELSEAATVDVGALGEREVRHWHVDYSRI